MSTTTVTGGFGADVGSGLIVAIVGLFGAWIIGTRVTDHWADVKHRRELDLAARDAFYASYGDLFAVQKMWDVHKRFPEGRDPERTPVQVRMLLLERATVAEAHIEALVVKLTSERHLDAQDRRLLAAFRQAYQSVRERIRADEPINWWATLKEPRREGYREYRAFKALSVHFAHLLGHVDEPIRGLADGSRPAEVVARIRLLAHGRSTRMTSSVSRPTLQEAQAALEEVAAATYRHSWWELAEEKFNMSVPPPVRDRSDDQQNSDGSL